MNRADGIGEIEGKAATGSGERAGKRASFKSVVFLWNQTSAIAEVIVSSGTIVKCSAPFSSYETINAVFLVEELTKSRCATSHTRPEAVSILNGLFLVINSSINDASHPIQIFSLRLCAFALQQSKTVQVAAHKAVTTTFAFIRG